MSARGEPEGLPPVRRAAKLVRVVDGPTLPKTIDLPTLPGTQMVLGRQTSKGGVDVLLDCASLPFLLSRRHASVRIAADGDYIKDLNSTNGTYVNDVLTPIDRETKLFHDDLVGLGGPTHVAKEKDGKVVAVRNVYVYRYHAPDVVRVGEPLDDPTEDAEEAELFDDSDFLEEAEPFENAEDPEESDRLGTIEGQDDAEACEFAMPTKKFRWGWWG